MFREVTLQVMSARRGLLLMGAVAALAAAGCGGNTPSASSSNGGGGNNSPSNNPYGSPPSSPPDGGSPTAGNIGTGSNPTLGNYLVNSADGRTLYYFGLDLPGSGSQAPVSNCTGSCVAVWPIFHVDTPSPSATDLSASDFGELTRSDGTKQTTFRGWPLYEFSGDSKAGDTNGDNFVGSGGPWYVIRDPFYSVLNMNKNGTAIYLADPAGRTVYTFDHDTVGTASAPPVSNCTGSCLTSWPVFLANGTVVPTGVDPSKLTTFTRADGTKQSAFDGHPLYYFAGDAVPGDQKGNGFMDIWHIVDPTTL